MDMRYRPSGHLSHTGEAHFSDKDRRRRRLRDAASRIWCRALDDAVDAVLCALFTAVGSSLAELLMQLLCR